MQITFWYFVNTKLFEKDKKDSVWALWRISRNYCASILSLSKSCATVERYSKLDKNKVGLDIDITDSMKLFGCLEKTRNLLPLNFIIFVSKRYIYWCAKKGFQINIYFLQKEVEKVFDEQKMLSKLNLIEASFDKTWQLWLNLFSI